MNDDLRHWIDNEYRSEAGYATSVIYSLERGGWRIVPPGWDVVRLKKGHDIIVERHKKGKPKQITVPTLDIAEWYGS